MDGELTPPELPIDDARDRLLRRREGLLSRNMGFHREMIGEATDTYLDAYARELSASTSPDWQDQHFTQENRLRAQGTRYVQRTEDAPGPDQDVVRTNRFVAAAAAGIYAAVTYPFIINLADENIPWPGRVVEFLYLTGASRLTIKLGSITLNSQKNHLSDVRERVQSLQAAVDRTDTDTVRELVRSENFAYREAGEKIKLARWRKRVASLGAAAGLMFMADRLAEDTGSPAEPPATTVATAGQEEPPAFNTFGPAVPTTAATGG